MKISGNQTFWLLATVELVLIVWRRITPAIEMARQDAWISMLIALFAGMAIAYPMVRLCGLHPGQSLGIFSQALLGKWLGRLIVLPYLVIWYVVAAGSLRLFGDFIHLILLDRTPVSLIMMIMLALMAYLVVAAGITGIGRFSEIAGPIMILTLAGSFILNLGNADWKQILPVIADSGWGTILYGSYAPATFLSESLVILGIVPFMRNPGQALSRTLPGIGMTALIVAVATLMVILVFGPNVSAELRFPYFMFVRTINIYGFIQNVDIFVIFIWIFGLFARLSFFLFITSYEMANWFKIKNWRKTIWFGIPLIFILARLYPSETAIIEWDNWIVSAYSVINIGIPLFLLLVSLAKKRRRKSYPG